MLITLLNFGNHSLFKVLNGLHTLISMFSLAILFYLLLLCKRQKRKIELTVMSTQNSIFHKYLVTVILTNAFHSNLTELLLRLFYRGAKFFWMKKLNCLTAM